MLNGNTGDPSIVFNPTSAFIGWDNESGEAISPPMGSYLGRNAELIAPSGSGKTDRFMEDLRALTFSPSGYVYYDFAVADLERERLGDASLNELIGELIDDLVQPAALRIRVFYARAVLSILDLTPGFSLEDAGTYSQALKHVRTEFEKSRDAKADLGRMAAAITGRKA